MALLFGGFQAGMPVLGWAIGARFAKAMDAWGYYYLVTIHGFAAQEAGFLTSA